MSASKDAFGGARGRRELPRDCTASRPCPKCGKGWCQIYADGTVLCKRVPSARRKVGASGEFFVHRTAAAHVPATPVPPPGPRADDAALHAAYSAVRARLPLLDAHRRALRDRGLSDAAIDRKGYRSLGVSGRAALARAVVDAVGEDAAAGVPGIVRRHDGARRWLSLAGAPGLLVPVRSVDGRNVALKVRADDPGDGPKYTYLSSGRDGGPKARHVVHVPAFDGDRATIRVTEGELKSDVVTVLTGTLTISVPGVGAWRLALPVLTQLGATRVRVAFDADARTNPAVARAQIALVHALRAAGLAWSVETWDPALGKGLDDVLAASRSAA